MRNQPRQQPTPQPVALRRTGRRGSAILDSAVLLMPLMMMVLGLVDFSLGIFVRNSVQFAVREGCRYGVTGQTKSGMGHLDSIRDVVKQTSFGFVEENEQISITFYDRNGLGELTGSGSNASGNVLQVSVPNFQWQWIVVGAFGVGPLKFTVSSSDVLEPQNGVSPTL
jgi:hypothetical protein